MIIRNAKGHGRKKWGKVYRRRLIRRILSRGDARSEGGSQWPSECADKGISLEAQAEKIRAMATLHDHQLLDVLVDGGESAKSLKRPAMAKLLAMIDAGQVKTVIVAKLDRLTRSVRDLCELLERFERRGVALVSVAESLDTGSAAGRLVLNIMAAVSQWEREAIGERTRDALRHKRTNGERVGNLPYGSRLAAAGVHVEDNPPEQEILAEIRRLRQEGTSLRGIATKLNAQQCRTRQGTAWRLESVARVVNADAREPHSEADRFALAK